MAVLRCTVCGGELEINADVSIGVCKFCDSLITIPKNLDKKGNLYNRAIFLRQNNEFDKAAATYEDILKEDNSDAEAHWGLVLSKYGIEYVSDPRTGKHIPTCHRTQTVSILSDVDYLAALEYSDFEAQRVFEKEAKSINEIQAQILEISQKEPPYDVFICYKESDELGNRTEDSILAQELYYELSKKGYKVFFSRKTLESKLGVEYEPIIFAALNSAKVMVVLGTKAEHFNSVWVRNEWSRFLKMNTDAQKTIIPAYRGISPYELPIELSGLQSQDMSKIGFLQDLMDGIDRCLRNTKHNGETSEAKNQASSGQVTIERLLKNGETYLRLNNFTEAEEVYKRATKDYPENYEGWWGLIVCSTLNFSQASKEQNKVDVWYGYVKTLSSESTFVKLEKTYIEYLKIVAQEDAQKKIDEVNVTRRSFNEMASNSQKKLQNLENQPKLMEGEHKKALQAINERVSHCKSELAKANEAYEKYRTKAGFYTFGGVASGIFVFCTIIDGIANPSKAGGFINFLTWVVVIALAFIPISLFTKAADSGSYKKDIAKKQDDLNVVQSEIRKLEDEYKKSLQLNQAKIEQQKREIADIEGKIYICDAYVRDKAEALLRYFHSLRCKKIDVDIPFSEDITFSLEKTSGSDSEQVSIKCPACESMIMASKSDARQKGLITCSVCGNEIEIRTNS